MIPQAHLLEQSSSNLLFGSDMSDHIPNQLQRYDVPKGNRLSLTNWVLSVGAERPARDCDQVSSSRSPYRERVWVRARQCLSSEPKMLLWSLLHHFMMACEECPMLFGRFMG
jgi:hypothetical protein